MKMDCAKCGAQRWGAEAAENILGPNPGVGVRGKDILETLRKLGRQALSQPHEVLAGPGRVKRGGTRSCVCALAQSAARSGVLLATAGRGGLDQPSLAASVRQPTLILAGNDDPIVPPVNARIMARLIPNATLYIVNGGHLFLLTEKEQVAPLVHQFLRKGETAW
jgi:pimeloyl-ACP methyl ester carboxylesterase